MNAMKALVFLTICLLLLTTPLLAAPAETVAMQEASVQILENGKPLGRTVTVRFEENNQAFIRGIELLLLKNDPETNKENILLLKAVVENRLPRDLISGQVKISYLDADNELIASEQKDIFPPRLRKNNRGGRFFVKIPYDEKITAIEILLQWPGKTE